MKMYKYFLIICVGILLIPYFSFSQEKEAKLTLSFSNSDSVCKALVTSEDKPVKDVTVKLYVKRLFSLLPINEGTATDESGNVSFTMPKDLPGDENGKLIVVAKIEDDDNFGSLEKIGEVNWGVKKGLLFNSQPERSLSASREKAPIYFMVASDLIILAIWGTLIYIIFQVFKIKKISSLNKNKN